MGGDRAFLATVTRYEVGYLLFRIDLLNYTALVLTIAAPARRVNILELARVECKGDGSLKTTNEDSVGFGRISTLEVVGLYLICQAYTHHSPKYSI